MACYQANMRTALQGEGQVSRRPITPAAVHLKAIAELQSFIDNPCSKIVTTLQTFFKGGRQSKENLS